MADYAVMRTQAPIQPEQVSGLGAAIKAANPKVAAISVVHYTEPQVVVLHCGAETLSPGEIEALEGVANGDV